MKTLAYVSFGAMALLVVGTFVFAGLAAWFVDNRFGWLAFVSFIAAAVMLVVGAFFAHQAGLGVTKK